MAQITITIPDDKAPEILEAFASNFLYEINKLEGETKAQFAKRHLIEHIKFIYKDYKLRQPENGITLS